MKIQGIERRDMGERSRIVARFTWEDCDRPVQEIHFETEKEFADGLAPGADPFLVAGLMPAFRHGERRIAVEGEVCPVLRANLNTAMRILSYWYRLPARAIPIESDGCCTAAPASPRRAAFYYSGGVDSLTTLRLNRLAIPDSHPQSFKDGLLIFGLEMEATSAFDIVRDSLSTLARDTGIRLVPMFTNVRLLDDCWRAWEKMTEGALLASVAHAVGRRISSASLASSFDVSDLAPNGTHPVLDPLYSSHGLQVIHDGIDLSRLDKVRVLAEWDLGLQHLRVCNNSAQYREGQPNCGSCEKCLRTLLALLITGALDKAEGFRNKTVTEELIREQVRMSWQIVGLWKDLIEPLEQLGRHDLARAIRWHFRQLFGEVGWRGRLRRFDRRRLNGALFFLKQALWLGPRALPEHFFWPHPGRDASAAELREVLFKYRLLKEKFDY